MAENNKISETLKRIAVYGSLRQTMGNHRLIEHVPMHKKETIELPFKMISYGAFPALIPSNQQRPVVVEYYDLDPVTYARVERLEGYPHFYDKHTFVDSEGVNCEIYFVPNDPDTGGTHIEDWVSYKTNLS